MENIKDKLRLYARVFSFLFIDGVFVVLASFLTLLIRTEFDMNTELWNNYMNVFYYDILITLFVYSLFNLYRSLWQFASMMEMRRLIVSTLIANFVKMFAYGGPVIVIYKDIIRYFMTIPEEVSLIIQAGVYSKGGKSLC